MTQQSTAHIQVPLSSKQVQGCVVEEVDIGCVRVGSALQCCLALGGILLFGSSNQSFCCGSLFLLSRSTSADAADDLGEAADLFGGCCSRWLPHHQVVRK